MFRAMVFAIFVACLLSAAPSRLGAQAEPQAVPPDPGNAEREQTPSPTVKDRPFASGLIEKGERLKQDLVAGRKPFLTIGPGLILNSTTVAVSGKTYQARITNSPGESTYSLDLTFLDLPFSDSTGLYFINHNTLYSLPYQFVEFGIDYSLDARSPAEEETDSNSGGDSSDDGEARESRVTRRNVGTRVDGVYSTLIPTFYVETEKGARFGAGVGASLTSMRGSVDFENPAQQMLIWQTIANREEWFVALPALYQTSGLIELTSDPVSRALISTAHVNDHLHLLGQYFFLTDRFRPHPADLLLLQAFRGSAHDGEKSLEVTNEELYALAALQRSYIEYRNEPGAAYMLFMEIPFAGATKLRGSIGGPVLLTRGHEFRFEVFSLALYYPISFYAPAD